VSDATLFTDQGGRLSPFWRYLSIVSIFLVLWPPICGWVSWWMKFDLGEPLLGWIILIAAYSYLLFAIPALLAGIVHALAAVRFLCNTVLVPLATAGGATILMLALFYAMAPGPATGLTIGPAESYFFFFIASLTPSLICWRLTRRFARTT
jgi:hypothetical protein